MAIQKVNKEGISEQVFQQMKDLILRGEWKPGEKIPSEHVLAQSFGVSRVTVRGGLQRLSALGLLETRFGEGSFVKTAGGSAVFGSLIPAVYLNDRSLEEVLQFRMMIEGPVCAAACEHADDEQRRELTRIYGKMKTYRGELREFAAYDYQFHLKLAEMTGNTILIRMYNIVNDVMRSAFDRIVLARGNQAGLHYHGLIVEAFTRGDSKGARAAMEEHMRDLCESYAKNFDDGGLI